MTHSDSSTSGAATGPDFSPEATLIDKGYTHIAGVDEAGRGPLAGPVVAAAVILDPSRIPQGLNDSKKLSAPRREQLFTHLLASARIGIASAPPQLILERNIRGATLWAMNQAVLTLNISPDMVLVDGRDIPPGLPCDAQALVKGDARSLSIAAASIVAKVSRDAMCHVLDRAAPAYGFGAHKGYGTRTHLQALEALGPLSHHRAGFAPVRAALKQRTSTSV